MRYNRTISRNSAIYVCKTKSVQNPKLNSEVMCTQEGGVSYGELSICFITSDTN